MKNVAPVLKENNPHRKGGKEGHQEEWWFAPQ
jgi:hypothetical protein